MRYEYARPLHHMVRLSCCARRIVIASPALVNMRVSQTTMPSTERVEPMGPIVARSEAAAAGGVLSGGSSLAGRGLLEPRQPTHAVFKDLNPISEQKEEMVDQGGASWNRIARWLGRIEHLQEARGALHP